MYITFHLVRKMGLRGHFYSERSPNRPFVTNYVLSIVDWVFVLKVFVTKSRNKHSACLLSIGQQQKTLGG